jgi:hypothetical protein
VLNVILAVYDQPHIRPYPSVLNNQRSADSGYRYAWFTRDLHDDQGNRELNRLKMLKNVFNRKYPNSNENLSN